MRIFLALALITLPMGVDAATPHKNKQHKRPVVHRVQQHYSFIPTRQIGAPNLRSAETETLTGQVQQINHTAEPVKVMARSALAMPTPDSSVMTSRKHLLSVRHFWKHRISATRAQSAAISMKANEAAQLSSAAADMISSLSKTDNPLFLLPSPNTDTRFDTFTPSLMHKLRDAGFKLASEPNEVATPVRYRVSHYQNTYVLHISVKSTQLARLFKLIDGALIAASPLSSTQEQP